jgi:hypothetical protein
MIDIQMRFFEKYFNEEKSLKIWLIWFDEYGVTHWGFITFSNFQKKIFKNLIL